MTKFVVTIPIDIKAHEPIEVELDDAVLNTGLARSHALVAATRATVWTEAEWKETTKALTQDNKE